MILRTIVPCCEDQYGLYSASGKIELLISKYSVLYALSCLSENGWGL